MEETDLADLLETDLADLLEWDKEDPSLSAEYNIKAFTTFLNLLL